jgi:hypothetical protein
VSLADGDLLKKFEAALGIRVRVDNIQSDLSDMQNNLSDLKVRPMVKRTSQTTQRLFHRPMVTYKCLRSPLYL